MSNYWLLLTIWCVALTYRELSFVFAFVEKRDSQSLCHHKKHLHTLATGWETGQRSHSWNRVKTRPIYGSGITNRSYLTSFSLCYDFVRPFCSVLFFKHKIDNRKTQTQKLHRMALKGHGNMFNFKHKHVNRKFVLGFIVFEITKSAVFAACRSKLLS